MATISKFYLLDATSPNTGTMPSSDPGSQGGAVDGLAPGALTVRDATDVAGTSNPDIQSQITSLATTTTQKWSHRRFVSRPLAARTFAIADGNWTYSYARSESNLNHNLRMPCYVYLWRPSTGARIGSNNIFFATTEPLVAASQETESVTNTWLTSSSIVDGDILVFDVYSQFTQGMATAYTDQFAYNGTTEASTTTCASFVTPPSALTLYTPDPTFNLGMLNVQPPLIPDYDRG